MEDPNPFVCTENSIMCFPFFEYGEEQCISLPEVTVPLGWVGLEDAVIPELEFCVRPFFVGTMRIFGQVVEVFAVLILLSSIMLWRWLRQS